MQSVPCINYEETIQLDDSSRNAPRLKCPFCLSEGVPIFQFALFEKKKAIGAWSFVVKCPCCGGRYLVSSTGRNTIVEGGGQICYDWRVEAMPFKTMLTAIPETIKRLSPSFEEIYNESRAAHNHGLTQIVGGGYRKALEFLIRDYAIAKDPTNKSSIRTMLLGTCISSYLGHNPDLRAVADRVSWLGNDEVHYTKEWKDKDIEHMSFMLEYLISMIDMEVRSKELVQSMPKNEK